MGLQKNREKSYSALNLTKYGEVDKEAVFNYINANIESEWNETVTTVFEECFKALEENQTNIERIFTTPPFNITKSDCDYNYWALEYCREIEEFVVSIFAAKESLKTF